MGKFDLREKKSNKQGRGGKERKVANVSNPYYEQEQKARMFKDEVSESRSLRDFA